MLSLKHIKHFAIILLVTGIQSCKVPDGLTKEPSRVLPEYFSRDSSQISVENPDLYGFYQDSFLIALIDTALSNNQELLIMAQEIKEWGYEVDAKKGEYLPSVRIGADAGLEKQGRYTVQGATEATTDIKPGEEMPEPVPNLAFGAYASWEIDVWKKLRNSKKAAMYRYFASEEGRNYMITRLVAEIAKKYYELVALDNQLATLDKNIELQTKALAVVRAQKQSAKVTELAVQKFEAEVAKTKSMRFEIAQEIIETENTLNYLVGRYPQPVARTQKPIHALAITALSSGLPADLLQNRPDIRKAELELEAAKLDVKSARAEFFPSISLKAGVGYEAFNPAYLIQSPQSLLYGFIGELSAPVLNRKAIQANYSSAGARQLKAVYFYEQTVLTAYIEVVNTLSGIENLNESLTLKNEQVLALSKSISIANNLFTSARADYMEVLMTQRDMLEATFELIDTKKEQLNAGVTLYESLGGGWK